MKSLAKNSIYNILYKCSNFIFPLIVSAYVSRILLAEGVGKVSSAQNIVTYFAILAALGLPTYGTKVIASCSDNRDKRSKAFSELFIINAISTIICSIAYYIMVIQIPYFQQRQSLFIVCGLSIVFNIINVDWFYQGCEEYGYIMIRNLLIKVISLVAIFIFVRSVDDYIKYAAVLTFSKVANNIFNIVHLKKYASFTFQDLRIIQHIKPVFVFLAASIAIEIYTLADTTMLTFIHGDKIVGYYTTARKGIDVIRTMIIAVCAVFLPRLSYYYSNKEYISFKNLMDRGIKILMYITIPATIGVMLTAQYFVPLMFGEDFSDAIITTEILAISIITVAFSNFFGYQVLVTIGKEKEMLVSTIIGAIINITLNFALIFSFKHNGVAIASAITELCVTLYQTKAVNKEFCIKTDKKFILSVLTGTFLMTLFVVICQLMFDGDFVCLSLSIIVGILLYGMVTLGLKNEISVWIWKKIKRV